jgi:hypothetical protein
MDLKSFPGMTHESQFIGLFPMGSLIADIIKT